jgi:hypothetical protein
VAACPSAEEGRSVDLVTGDLGDSHPVTFTLRDTVAIQPGEGGERQHQHGLMAWSDVYVTWLADRYAYGPEQTLYAPVDFGFPAASAWPAVTPFTSLARDYTAATYSPGKGVLALRFDDSGPLDYSFIFPALASRGLVAGFAVITSELNTSQLLTVAQLQEMEAAGNEVMVHSMTHTADPTSAAQFSYETTAAAAALRALGFSIASFVQPGTWVGAANHYNITTSAFYGSAEDLELRAHYSAYEAYIGAGLVDLPITGDGRYGAAHYSGDPETLATNIGYLDLITPGKTMEILYHSANLPVGGGITQAELLTLLDNIKARVDAGTLQILTPTQRLYATSA